MQGRTTNKTTRWNGCKLFPLQDKLIIQALSEQPIELGAKTGVCDGATVCEHEAKRISASYFLSDVLKNTSLVSKKKSSWRFR